MAKIKKVVRATERVRKETSRKAQYIGGKRRRKGRKSQDIRANLGEIIPSEAIKVATIAQKVGADSLRRSRELTGNEDRSLDQEAAEQYESLVTSTVDTCAEIAQKVSGCAKNAQITTRQIRKKTSDIKNTRDIRTNNRTMRKVDNSAKFARKSVAEASMFAQKSANDAAKQSVIVSQKFASARKAEQLARKSAEWVKKIVKGIIEGIKTLVAALSAASIPIVIILVLSGCIAAVVGSAFGIFFTEQAGNDTSLREVIFSMNQTFSDQIADITASTTYDDLEIRGARASWADILAIYAVDIATNSINPQDVATVTDEKIARLQEIFDDMNSFSYYTEEVTETEQVQEVDEEGNPVTDDAGNPVLVEQEVVRTVLHIDLIRLSAEEEAIGLGFTDDQIALVNALLTADYRSLWSPLLLGIGGGSQDLVNVALSQLGNEGGQTYWSWAGLSERCPWCALFVSWCADQTGLLASGQIPYFSFCADGVAWYQAKGAWIDGIEVNASNCEDIICPGMIVFFDWADHAGRRDGVSDHVGIVTGVSGGTIYTVEGNNGDAVREDSYSVENESVIGFGVVS